MKKSIKIFLYSLSLVIIFIIAASYISYWSYSPELESTAVNDQNTSYFFENYEECRSEFINLSNQLKSQMEGVSIDSIRVESSIDTNLSIDFCFIPSVGDSSKLVVISSGVHGIEGYTGSAVQRMMMNEMIPEIQGNRPAILLIHGVNPYGFKYKRRVTENNVDLNRNSSLSNELYNIGNSGYADLYDFVNPANPASEDDFYNKFFYMVAIAKIAKSSMPVLRQAVLQGQYEFPEGLYFGGDRQEPQISALEDYLPMYFDKFKTILHIDLHTGYGEIGKLHLFANPVENDELKNYTTRVFEGLDIDWGDSDDFYTVSGDFCSFIGDLNPDATFISMPFEYGTLNSQKTFGSLHSIQKTILENQGIQHGYQNAKQEDKIKSSFIEMYYPSDPEWRSLVIEQSREVLNIAIQNYTEFK
ncbi:MAG: DUF2817 domain-containing protein [Bacteroidales bacterium]|nr:DUF2817 domain-containing protein [Bacteroidales bacterium]MCF8389392.1 DUF2817 domain-containing protein [Bacteroidales bacterium]